MLGYVFYQKWVEETVTAEVFRELLHGGFREWQEKKEESETFQQRVYRKLPEQVEEEGRWEKNKDTVPRSRKELLDAFFRRKNRKKNVLSGI